MFAEGPRVWSIAPTVLALTLVVVLSAFAVHEGLTTPDQRADVDQQVYEQTLADMRSGRGYYEATAEALAEKEGAPPSQLRSVRPPTLFLGLSVMPEGGLRWAAGAVYVACLSLAWLLARRSWRWAGPIAVLLVGTWMVAAAPHLYLHAELWGLPFALAGALAMRNDRWGMAAALFVMAACTRELYAPFLLAGLVLAPSRRPFVVGVVAFASLAILHFRFVSQVLVADGRESSFRPPTSVGEVLGWLSPSAGPLAVLLGVTMLIAGGAVLGSATFIRRRAPERVIFTASLALVFATAVAGRTYWPLTFAPLVGCYAAMLPGEWSALRASKTTRALALPR